MNIATKTHLTPDELASMPDEQNFELVNGLLVERAMGSLSSWVGGHVLYILTEYCRRHRLGWVWPADNGFKCFADPDTVRKPDVSFVRFGRLPGEQPPTGYVTLAPDLAVEVISPTERAYSVDEKVADYLGAGVPLVWVINPVARTVRVHRPGKPGVILGEADELTGEHVLPGFRCAVADLFRPQAPAPAPGRPAS